MERVEHFVISNDWMILKDISFEVGWGNGYVAIPKDHPCYGIDYNILNSKYNLDIELTFSSVTMNNDEIPEEYMTGYWIVGFDTMHLGMNRQNWPKSRVEEEAAKLAFKFYEIWLLDIRKKKRNTDRSKVSKNKSD